MSRRKDPLASESRKIRDETRLPRRVGTRFEGVFLHGGSFNAITRATPGASPSCLSVLLCPSRHSYNPLFLFPPFFSSPPSALSSFVAATLTTATHHFLAHEPTLARTLSLSVFHPPSLLLSSSRSYSSSSSSRRTLSFSSHSSLAAHVIPHYFHFIVSNLG